MTRFGIGRVLACATAVLTIGACSAPGSSQSAPADTSGPIKIAVVDAQSGQLSSLGAWESKGAKLAVDQWNAKGGINGRKIQVDVFDDTGDPTVGTNLALMSDNVEVTNWDIIASLPRVDLTTVPRFGP